MKKPTREILKDACEKAHSIFELQQHEAEATIRPVSYKNQSNDLLRKSVDWFLYDRASVPKELNKSKLYCNRYANSVF